jgi:hypothetical protein
MKKIFKNNTQLVVAAAKDHQLIKLLVIRKNLILSQIRKNQVKLKLFSITNGIQVLKWLDILLSF